MDTQNPVGIYYQGLYSFYNGDKLKGCESLLRAEKLGVSEATAFLEFNCR
jgi:hypothetical protein